MRHELSILMRRWLGPLASQERAVANAREASTALTARAVEREDVRLFLEALGVRQGRANSA